MSGMDDWVGLLAVAGFLLVHFWRMARKGWQSYSRQNSPRGDVRSPGSDASAQDWFTSASWERGRRGFETAPQRPAPPTSPYGSRTMPPTPWNLRRNRGV